MSFRKSNPALRAVDQKGFRVAEVGVSVHADHVVEGGEVVSLQLLRTVLAHEGIMMVSLTEAYFDVSLT